MEFCLQSFSLSPKFAFTLHSNPVRTSTTKKGKQNVWNEATRCAVSHQLSPDVIPVDGFGCTISFSH